MPTPSPKPLNPLRFATLLCLLAGCSQPLMPSQGSKPSPSPQPVASASPAAPSAASQLHAVPQDLQGEWIETQQPGGPSDEEGYPQFRARTLTQLAQGALPLTETPPEAADSRIYPYAAFYNGRAPVMGLSQRSYTWNDFRTPMPGTSRQPGDIGFDGKNLVVPSTPDSPGLVYYVSKGHDQIVYIPSEADFNGRITVYLRESETRKRYGMCLNPAENNAIDCSQL